jgi:hypothetical protein
MLHDSDDTATRNLMAVAGLGPSATGSDFKGLIIFSVVRFNFDVLFKPL